MSNTLIVGSGPVAIQLAQICSQMAHQTIDTDYLHHFTQWFDLPTRFNAWTNRRTTTVAFVMKGDDRK